ncbi:hypothetical protein Tco_0892533 [Tanacetum coccineum]|uniref:Uncharacterized protein n=1 Tax=Tanacetum coccineum TaxID=301880 RepID=A0ABQ5C659_9ASTR
MPTHNRIHIAPPHTKKIFRNMRMVGKETKPRKPNRKDTQIPQSSGPTEHVADEAVYKELDDSLVRAATTTSSLEAEQDNGNIIKTRSKATPNEAGSQITTSGGGPRHQETMGDTIAQTRFEYVSKLSNDLLLARAKVESSGDEESLDDADMFDVNTLASEEVFVAEESGNVVEEVVVVIDAASTIPINDATITDVEVTLAQALAELKSAKPKADKHVVEKVKPIKRLEQMRLNEELAFKLQAEEEEEERLAREKAQQIKEANIAWDDVQAKVEAD